MNFAQSIIERGNLVYCEMVRAIFLVNCGWSFTALWAVAKNFVDPNVLKPKFFGTHILWEPIFLGTEILLWTQFFWGSNFSGPKFFQDQNIFKLKIIHDP